MMHTRQAFQFLLLWFLSFVVLLLLDMAWFSISMERVYKPLYIKIQKRVALRLWSGIVVWILLGLMVALITRQEKERAGTMGLLYGLIIYGVYNFTNHATLYNYNLRVTIIDTMWGSLAIGITAFLMAGVHRKL
jgi:uncharacterized membrane protein